MALRTTVSWYVLELLLLLGQPQSPSPLPLPGHTLHHSQHFCICAPSSFLSRDWKVLMPVARSISKEGNKHWNSQGKRVETVTYYRDFFHSCNCGITLAAYRSVHYLKSKIVTKSCASSGLFDHWLTYCRRIENPRILLLDCNMEYKKGESAVSICLLLNTLTACFVVFYISRVPDQNGVSQAWYIVEIHHSGRKPSIWNTLNSSDLEEWCIHQNLRNDAV